MGTARRMGHSLQTRVVVAALAVLLGCMGTLGYYLHRMAAEELDLHAQARVEGLTQLLAQRIDDELRLRQQALRAAADALGSSLPEATWTTAGGRSLPSVPDGRVQAAALGGGLSDPWLLVRRDGSAVAARDGGLAAAGAGLPDELVQQVLREAAAVRALQLTGTPAVWLGQPVINSRGQVVGGLLAWVDATTLQLRYPGSAGLSMDTDRVAILDRLNGLSVVAASHAGWPPKPLPPAWRMVAGETMPGQPRSLAWTHADRSSWITGAAPVPATQWVLTVSRPAEAALMALSTEARQTGQRAVLVTLALGTLAAVLVSVVLNRSLRPLRRVTAAIDDQARRGQALQPLRVEGSGEVQILLEAFNRLSEVALQRETELTLSRDFTRDLARNIPGLFAYWGRDLRCEFINLAYAEHLGRSVEQAEGQHMDMLLPPEQRLNLLASVNGALMGIPQRFEQAHVGPAGAVSYFLVQYLPQTRGAIVSGFFSLMTDITEQRQKYAALEETEGLLRAAQFTSRMAAFVGYMRSGAWRGPPPLQDLLGLPPGSLLTTDTLLSLVVPESRARVRERLYEVGSRQGRLDLELQIQRPRSGKPCWLHLVGASSWSPQRRELVFYGTLQDVSERKLADALLVQARREAVLASRAKSQFLGQLGQDVRLPAERLLSLTRLLDATPLDPRQQQWLGQARATAESLVRVIDSVHDLSQIEKGALTLVHQPFHVQHLLEGLARSAGAITPTGVTLHFDIEAGLPMHLSGDGPRLQQALHNLLATLLRSTQAGEVMLRVETRPAAQGRVRLAFCATDTGPGLSADTLGRLREPVTSELDLSLAAGLPLPLLLSRHLVQAMGGLLTAPDSDTGSRLVFDVEFGLPAEPVTSAPAGETLASDPPPEVAQRLRRVWALDACTTSLQLLQRAVQRLGGHLEGVGSAADLLQRVTGQPASQGPLAHPSPSPRPGLVLLCARTADLPQLLAALTEHGMTLPPDTRPAIALMAYEGDLSPARRDLLAQWVDVFLQRPLWAESLADALAAVDWPAMARRARMPVPAGAAAATLTQVPRHPPRTA